MEFSQRPLVASRKFWPAAKRRTIPAVGMMFAKQSHDLPNFAHSIYGGRLTGHFSGTLICASAALATNRFAAV